MTAAISILSVVASVIGIYGVYWAIIRERKKLFAFEVSRGLAVASTSRIGGDYELSVHFKLKGGAEERIEGAYLQFVRFANLGRESVRAADNAPANPLRLVVAGARVLDIALVDQKREVNQVKLSPPKLSDSGGETFISFDYLDQGDGALVRVLTAGQADLIEIRGDVIDMPGGIVCTSPEGGGETAMRIGVFLFLAAEIALFGLTAWIFYKATGTWANALLLPLPLLALLSLWLGYWSWMNRVQNFVAHIGGAVFILTSNFLATFLLASGFSSGQFVHRICGLQIWIKQMYGISCPDRYWAYRRGDLIAY